MNDSTPAPTPTAAPGAAPIVEPNGQSGISPEQASIMAGWPSEALANLRRARARKRLRPISRLRPLGSRLLAGLS